MTYSLSLDRRAFLVALMTIAIAAQGWFAGALIHGAEHLNW